MKSFTLKIGFYSLGNWITPLLRQCFVTAGVSLNTAAVGLVMSFSVVLEQLKLPGSSIPIDDEELSWLASVPGIFAFPGAIIVIPIMGRYGRRTANLVSISILIVSWAGIAIAPNIAALLLARALQGINLGMISTLGSLLIGEYTSPRNRGAFLITMSVSIALGSMFVHVISFLMTRRIGALVCAFIAIIDLAVVFLSPESPSWLASQGQYDECKKAFWWLRGDTEEEELDKIIKACRILRNSSKETDVSESMFTKVQNYLIYFKATASKPEFYKPLIIVCHLYPLLHWSGVNLLVGFPREYLLKLNGYEGNISGIIISLDLHRILACTMALYIIKKIKRRIMLLAAISMNVIALLALAAYSYAREHFTLPFDHPMIGILLSHILMFPISTGSTPLPLTIPGEIFPLKDKTLAGGIGILVFSFHLFLSFKVTLIGLTTFGMCWFLCTQAVILIYCMIVVWFLLPETKDRTLQDIEDEFRGKPPCQENQA